MIFIHNRQACGEAERKGENPEDVKRPLNLNPAVGRGGGCGFGVQGEA